MGLRGVIPYAFEHVVAADKVVAAVKRSSVTTRNGLPIAVC